MTETAFELSDTVARLKVPIANPPVRQLANRYGGPDSRIIVNWQVCQFETERTVIQPVTVKGKQRQAKCSHPREEGRRGERPKEKRSREEENRRACSEPAISSPGRAEIARRQVGSPCDALIGTCQTSA